MIMYQYFDDLFKWLVQEPELEILALITVFFDQLSRIPILPTPFSGKLT